MLMDRKQTIMQKKSLVICTQQERGRELPPTVPALGAGVKSTQEQQMSPKAGSGNRRNAGYMLH